MCAWACACSGAGAGAVESARSRMIFFTFFNACIQAYMDGHLSSIIDVAVAHNATLFINKWGARAFINNLLCTRTFFSFVFILNIFSDPFHCIAPLKCSKDFWCCRIYLLSIARLRSLIHRYVLWNLNFYMYLSSIELVTWQIAAIFFSEMFFELIRCDIRYLLQSKHAVNPM